MQKRIIDIGLLAVILFSIVDYVLSRGQAVIGVQVAILPVIAALLATAGSNLLGNLFGKQKNPAAAPEEVNLQRPDAGNYKFSNQELSGIQSSAVDRLLRGGAMTQQNIMQQGAASGAPQGAMLDSLAGANYNLGRGFGGLSGELANMQMQGKTNYANALQQNNFAQADIRQRFFEGKRATDNSRAAGWGNMFGDLGKIGTLWSGGYFDQSTMASQPQKVLSLARPESVLG